MFPHLCSYSDVFSDRFGVLEGEELVRGSSVRGDLRYCEQQVVLNDHKYHSKLNHRCLRPIVTTSSAARPAGGKFEAWLALNRQTSPSISIHIYGSEPRGFPESINSLVCFNATTYFNTHFANFYIGLTSPPSNI